MEKWSAENFNELRRKSGLRNEDLAAATGIPLASLYSYAAHRVAPSLNVLITIADYFAVPADFLLGRMPEDKARELIENYSSTFMELRRAPYEAYLYGRREMREYVVCKGESPWPYNLLDAIFREKWSEPLSEDQMNGLDYVIGLTDERTQKCLRLYYQMGYTLQEVGDQIGISRERVRQIIWKTCRKLIHPARSTFILQGFEAASREIRNEEEEARLAELEESLREKEADLKIKQDKLENWGVRLQKVAASNSEMSLYDMDFSTRAENILRRRGAETLSDVVTILDTGRFDSYRGVGKQVLNEVTKKVGYLTGKDYSQVYDL